MNLPRGRAVDRRHNACPTNLFPRRSHFGGLRQLRVARPNLLRNPASARDYANGYDPDVFFGICGERGESVFDQIREKGGKPQLLLADFSQFQCIFKIGPLTLRFARICTCHSSGNDKRKAVKTHSVVCLLLNSILDCLIFEIIFIHFFHLKLFAYLRLFIIKFQTC